MGRAGSAQAKNAPKPETTVGIRFESGDIVVELEGDADPKDDGVPDRTFRWGEREAGAPRHCLRPSRLSLAADLIFVSWCTFVPPRNYRWCWRLELHSCGLTLIIEPGPATKACKF